MFNMNEMLGKLKEMQEEIAKTRERLDSISVEGDSGGGMVRVIASASRKVLKIVVDPDLINPNDKEMMEDLITAAVNKALDEADRVAAEEMKKATKGMPQIPGMDIGNFGI